jgi:transcriptional regulator with PAS, ATPase and Fis domain
MENETPNAVSAAPTARQLHNSSCLSSTPLVGIAARIAAARALSEGAKRRLDNINLMKAENVISNDEARKLTRQVESAAKEERLSQPATPAQLQPGQMAMKMLDRFVTCDPDLIKVKERVKTLATVHYPVLIRGDSGTGKELIARALHGNRVGPFVAINCAAISENLIESELFGHVKGAFTGAFNDRAGLLIKARGGTAFLDEIGDLPYALQAKLLRALQNRVVRRVGSNDDEEIDCRIVAATHKGIESSLNDTFRLDLYYRLSTFILDLKKMGERTYEDFELISKHFGGDDEDTQRLWVNRGRMKGNFRDIEQYFIRKKVLGILSYE